MELGGKTPVMVFDDFDVDQAVNYAAFGAFVGAGQTCVCASRHIVQAKIYDEFVEKLKRKTESIRIGDPFDASTQLGPVISARQRDRVLSYARFGLEDGARLVIGGVAPRVAGHEGGFFVAPMVFADVRADMRIFQQEVFGPFTSVTPFTDEADALRLANDPVALPAVGFALTIPIYVLVALLFGIYIPELFPTEVRLRASGIVNTLGPGATIVTPFFVVMLFEARGVAGVMSLMIGLLLVQIVTVWALGIEPRHRSLEELKGDEVAPTLLKEAS